MADSLSGRLQDLRDFTVRICTRDMHAIAGTGVAVSDDGLIATCAHVVQTALGEKRRPQPGDEVGVYFPQARGAAQKDRIGIVERIFPEADDDVVLLRIKDGGRPLAPEQIAVLGSASASEGNDFRSYGYQRLDKYQAGRAQGKILGQVEPPEGERLQADPVQLESNQINRGMSGSAVLDVQRNLVVGLISETFYADKSLKNQNTAWAVDGAVLGLEPLRLLLRSDDLPLRPRRQPMVDETSRVRPPARLGCRLDDAPALLKEWVGRESLLAALDGDWQQERVRVLSLTAFGGEGKSSLARKWAERLQQSAQPPDGIFWWSCESHPNTDAFFEAALGFLTGGQFDPAKCPGTNRRANLLVDALLLNRGRVLLILDGFEVMQHSHGDAYGTIRDADLREFLRLFADGDNRALCLITSRLPLLDMLAFPACVQRDVDRLTRIDGRSLLRLLGIQGSDEALDALVEQWDGHALTLSLLAAYLKEKCAGDASRAPELPSPAGAASGYARVHSLLASYDAWLAERHRIFLKIFSAFRTPVSEKAFSKVFRPRGRPTPPLALSAAKPAFDKLVNDLLAYRLVRYDATEKQYSLHPLVRAHYRALMKTDDEAQVRALHARIHRYYQSTVKLSESPTLDELKPLLESVHHACRAGRYDLAFNLFHQQQIILRHQYGAFETVLSVLRDFFPDGELSTGRQATGPADSSVVLQLVGTCLTSLGRLAQAVPFFERAIHVATETRDWANASTADQVLARLYAAAGEVEKSGDEAAQALRLVDESSNALVVGWYKLTSFFLQGRAAYLRGKMAEARADFDTGEKLVRKEFPDQEVLYGESSRFYADLLLRAGDAAEARRRTLVSLDLCAKQPLLPELSLCHRILGDLDSSAGDRQSARNHYDIAHKTIRATTDRGGLLEVLLARGRFFARVTKEVELARADLDEALDYSMEGGYELFECDVRVARTWLFLSQQDFGSAKNEANCAQQIATKLDYHWGKVDADEALAAIPQLNG